MKTRSLLTAIGISLFGLSDIANAGPAVYRDGAMSIDSGIVLTPSRQEYYSNIVMTTDSEGRLQIVSYEPRPLTYVNSVDATVVETDTERSVELTIAGDKSVPCVGLEEVAVSYKAGVFTVLVAETVLGPGESCSQVLDPFVIDVPLDVSGLDAGVYGVVVNNEVETEFELTTDAP